MQILENKFREESDDGDRSVTVVDDGEREKQRAGYSFVRFSEGLSWCGNPAKVRILNRFLLLTVEFQCPSPPCKFADEGGLVHVAPLARTTPSYSARSTVYMTRGQYQKVRHRSAMDLRFKELSIAALRAGESMHIGNFDRSAMDLRFKGLSFAKIGSVQAELTAKH
ncbi:hypothetical protein NL676_014456 [Syzygium grande]|nr:hypothetical protein NL676_014456 [Syzygium grande]